MIIRSQINRSVVNFKTSEEWTLFSADEDFNPSQDDFVRAMEICNEPLVYQWLFNEKFEGRPYTLEKAKGFIEWAQEGWKNQKYFVFLIKDSNDVLQAAVDIKSNNLEESEIGYWASGDNPGVMTNAVVELCLLASQSGYKKLFADVQKLNQHSVKVLIRAGFSLEKEFNEDGKEYHRYSKILE